MAVIGTNQGSINSAFYLTLNNESLNKSIRRLSSGSRLADPVEDAAGVAISGNFKASVRRLQSAVEGAQTMISFAQTADGFLNTIQQQLTRMSELAQRATNGSFGETDRANYQSEFSTLKNQISKIISNATFDGTTIFTAGDTRVWGVTTDPGTGRTTTVPSNLTYIAAYDTVYYNPSSSSIVVGWEEKRLGTIPPGYSSSWVRMDAGAAWAGERPPPAAVLSYLSVTSGSLPSGTTPGTSGTTLTIAIDSRGLSSSLDTLSIGALSTVGLGISNADVGTIASALSAISLLNTAITSIGSLRAGVNADIAKFNFHIQNIRTEKINLESANSRISDLDIALESTALSKSNILLQAATAMLAQANNSMSSVLSLLR